MPLAIVLLLLVLGTVLFHFLSPWWLTPIASNWGSVDTTIIVTIAITGVAFLAVNFFLIYCLIRYRHRKGHKADYDPENPKLEGWLTVGTAVGVAALLAPGLVVWATFVTVPEEATEFEVVGQQWHWSFRFPGEDEVLGITDVRSISPDNPFGLSREDPRGQDDVLVSSPIVHLPVDQPVKVLLRSKDVLHNFAVPQFRAKMDLVPGLVSSIWFTPTRVGEYEILCEELCGLAHHTMRGRVVVEEESDFQAWFAGQPTFAELSTQPTGDPVAGQITYALCAACHGPQGQGMQPLNAAKLTGQEAWYLKRQLQYFKHGVRGTHEQDIFGATMAPIMAALPNDTAINDVVAYIGTLPDQPAPVIVTGDTARGEYLYATCAACHGADGQGLWATNAPSLVGINDWYLVTQLKNYKAEIRGSHPGDLYGDQMMLMADILIDDQAINDVVAYVNTLR